MSEGVCVRDLLVVVRIVAVMVVVRELPTTTYSVMLLVQLLILSTCSFWLPPSSHRVLCYYCLPLLLLLQATYQNKIQLTNAQNHDC